MSQIWMFTAPMEKVHKRELKAIIDANDCKKWQIGMEVGKNGYRHYQGRLVSSNDDFFDRVTARIPTIHLEKGDHWCNYEGKEGHYWTSDDTVEIRKVRFGTPNEDQKAVIKSLMQQSDREIDVWYDPRGNAGKSWLVNHLWEKHQAHYIAPYFKSVQAMVQDCASKQMADRRPIIVIDIPRSWKWSEELYTGLETIKDGLIDDPRYSAKTVNIRGTKILVLTNTKAKLDKLSIDRWVLNGVYSDGTTRKDRARARHSTT